MHAIQPFGNKKETEEHGGENSGFFWKCCKNPVTRECNQYFLAAHCPDGFLQFWKNYVSNADCVIFEVWTPSNQLGCEIVS